MNNRSPTEFTPKVGAKIPEFEPGRKGPKIFSASVMNRLVKSINAFLNPKIARGDRDSIEISDSNVLFTLKSAADGVASAMAMYKIRAVADDYIICRSWNGTALGATDVPIAKPHILRTSITSEVRYGSVSGTPTWITHNYTYAYDPNEPDNAFDTAFGETAESVLTKLNKIRTGTQVIGPTVEPNEVEEMQVSPEYLKGQIIYAADVVSTGVTVSGAELKLLEDKPDRQWMAIG